MAGIIAIFVLNDKKLSSHMAQISEHINSPNHNICSCDKIIKIIVNLDSKNFENNNNFTYIPYLFICSTARVGGNTEDA